MSINLKNYSTKARRLIFKLFHPKYCYSKRQIYILFSSGLIILSSLYLLISLLLVSSERVALVQLKNSFNLTGPCHEECINNRKYYENIIANSLKQNKRLRNEVINHLLDKLHGIDYKTSLLHIVKKAYGSNPPDFIIQILSQEVADEELRAKIIAIYLINSHDKTLNEYYFDALNKEAGLNVRKEVIKALSNYSSKQEYLPELENLKRLTLNNETPLNLKADIMFLLSDTYSDLPNEVKEVLINIYASSTDLLIQAMAAEMLSSFGVKEIIIPTVPDREWEKII